MRSPRLSPYDHTWREKAARAGLSGSIAILVATGLLLSLL